MPGLCLETRHALNDELRRRVLDQPRMPDGSRAMLLMPSDTKVFGAFALDFYNGATGRCDPGYRAIRDKTGVALGTVSNSTRRLKAAGWIKWRLVLRYVHGSLRFCRNYILPDRPPELRSRSATLPGKELRERLVDKSGPQRTVRSAARQFAWATATFEPEAMERAARALAERGAVGMTKGATVPGQPAIAAGRHVGGTGDDRRRQPVADL